jgi:flavorubredoxin
LLTFKSLNMKKELILNIDGKLYNSSYIKQGNKFIVDTHHEDFKGILIDNFTFRVNHGKVSYLLIHSKTEEIGSQIINQILMSA